MKSCFPLTTQLQGKTKYNYRNHPNLHFSPKKQQPKKKKNARPASPAVLSAFPPPDSLSSPDRGLRGSGSEAPGPRASRGGRRSSAPAARPAAARRAAWTSAGSRPAGWGPGVRGGGCRARGWGGGWAWLKAAETQGPGLGFWVLNNWGLMTRSVIHAVPGWL